MTSNLSSVPTLSEVNSEGAKKYYGFIVFICVIFLPAIVGNSHILHIYICKKKSNNTRVYVIFIAVLDMINSVVCFPFQVINCLYPFEFESDIACKIFTFITYFVNICIPLSLLVVSTDRFRVIYKPFAVQISKGLAKTLCVLVFILSILFGVPSFILHGSVPIDTGVGGVIGRECNLSSSYGSGPFLYIAGLSIITILGAIVLIVLYTMMGIALRKQHNLLKNSNSEYKHDEPATRIKNVTSENKTSRHPLRDFRAKTLPRSFRPFCETKQEIRLFVTRIDIKGIAGNGCHIKACSNGHRRTLSESNSRLLAMKPPKSDLQMHSVLKRTEKQPENVIDSTKEDHIFTIQNGNSTFRRHRVLKNKPSRFNRVSQAFKKRKHTNSSVKKRNSQAKESFKRTMRVTIMFFWITFVYVVSFIPNPALRVIRYASPEWYDNMTPAGHIVYHLVIGSVFLASATNFFIYMFCDTMFRREICRWYRGVFCRFRHGLPDTDLTWSTCDSLK